MSAPTLSQHFSARASAEPEPFTTAFVEVLTHGVVAAVHLPDSPEPVPEHVLSRLQPEERAAASALRAYRQVSWAGGRLALHQAARQLGERGGAVAAGPRGEPLLPAGMSGSISHKRRLAVAIAARSGHGSLGIDLEDLSPARPGVAARVLTPGELAAVQALPPERQWTATTLRFSTKEAIYKALHPHVNRYVDFSEAEVSPDVDGRCQVALRLSDGEGPFRVEALYYWLPGQVIATVRVRPALRGRRR